MSARVGFLWFSALSGWREDWARVIIRRHRMQRRHSLASIVFYDCIMIKGALYSSLGVTDLEQFLEGNVVIWPQCLSTEKQSCLVFCSMSWLHVFVHPSTNIYRVPIIGPVFGKVEESPTLLSVARKLEDHSCKKPIARHLSHSKGWKERRFCERIRGFMFQLSKEEEEAQQKPL